MSSNRWDLAVLAFVAMALAMLSGIGGIGRMGVMGIQAREHMNGVASEQSCAETVEKLRAKVARMQQALQEMTVRAMQAEKVRDLLMCPNLVRIVESMRIDALLI